MATKDWIKTDNTQEKIRWQNKKNGNIVFVHNLKKGFYIKDYIGVEVMGNNAQNILSKEFKTKSKAMKFSRSYMRKN